MQMLKPRPRGLPAPQQQLQQQRQQQEPQPKRGRDEQTPVETESSKRKRQRGRPDKGFAKPVPTPSQQPIARQEPRPADKGGAGKVCQFWQAKGNCRFGDRCRFEHPGAKR